MKISKLKETSETVLNLTKEQFNKGFNLAKIKSDSVKEKINLKIREKAILATKARLAENHKTFEKDVRKSLGNPRKTFGKRWKPFRNI